MSKKKKKIVTRVTIVYFMFVILALIFFGKLFALKGVAGEEWKAKAKSVERGENIVEANRGDILDEKGMKLATSVPNYRLYMDLMAEGLTNKKFNENIDSLSICLSKFFRDKSASEYKRELQLARQNKRRYHRINQRRISYLELKQVKTFPIFRDGTNSGGFIVEQYDTRQQPFGSLASRSIGKLYGESTKGGMIGLERAYDDILKGVDGTSTQKRISGRWVSEVVIPPIDGYDVVTTIDIAIQDVAEHSLRKQLEMHNADHGVVILMEVKTGAIKAIVNLHRRSKGLYIEDYYNYAIGESTEPGSTFKLATIIAALEDRKVKLSDTIDTGDGVYQFYDRVMRDTHKGGYGKISVKEAFEKSSNVAMSKIIVDKYKDNPRRFVDRLYAMGLNSKLGVEILGEGEPIIKYPGDNSWSGVTLPWMSIGYEVKMTPLQLLTFYNAVANNGKMVKPMFVKGYSKHGKMVQRFSPQVINPSIASMHTIEQARVLLEGVVENGTGRNIRNEKYTIAGKTGTAQVAKGSEGYKSGGVEYQASFAGYFPADKPKYSCIVVVAAPSNNVYYGNIVAGSVFKDIADRVYASNFGFMEEPVVDSKLAQGVYPYSKGGPKKELMEIMKTLKYPMMKQGDIYDWVSTTAVDSGVVFKPKTIVEGIMPSVRGMGAKDAISVLENIGLNVNIRGLGSVSGQSIAEGTPYKKGNTVFLTLE